MKLKSSIRQALLTLLDQGLIVASWGLSDIKLSESSILFAVNGFKYKGQVVIMEYNNGYTIRMDGKSFDCNLCDLIKKLDIEIEKTDNYDSLILEDI